MNISVPRTCLTLLLSTLIVLPLLHGCRATSHLEQTATMGHSVPLAAMEALLTDNDSGTGPIELQTIVSADWVAPLSGLVNLDSAPAKAAGLRAGDEPIQVYIHSLLHPEQGLFLVDTGFSEQLVHDPGSLGVNAILRKGMNIGQIRFHTGPAGIVSDMNKPLSGIFLSHLHLDHIGGLSEVPLDVPVYAGVGETSESNWKYLFTQGAVDLAFGDRPPIQSWAFRASTKNTAQSNSSDTPVAELPELKVLDIFNDGSVFALSVPGHTVGSTAYLVRSQSGPVLLVGDTSHTRWGWENGVEPGNFTLNGKKNLQSLLMLKELVARHPQIEVRFGHQP